MSQAENHNKLSRLSRRTALAGLTVTAAAGVTALPAGASAAPIEPDPIFAVIAEHRAAVEAYLRASAISGELEDDTPEWEIADAVTRAAITRNHDALWEVFTVQPATLPGVAALLHHVGLPQFLKEELEYPDDRETFLSTWIHNDGSCEFKRAAQDFPVHLAETVRSLIGGQS